MTNAHVSCAQGPRHDGAHDRSARWQSRVPQAPHSQRRAHQPLAQPRTLVCPCVASASLTRDTHDSPLCAVPLTRRTAERLRCTSLHAAAWTSAYRSSSTLAQRSTSKACVSSSCAAPVRCVDDALSPTLLSALAMMDMVVVIRAAQLDDCAHGSSACGQRRLREAPRRRWRESHVQRRTSTTCARVLLDLMCGV